MSRTSNVRRLVPAAGIAISLVLLWFTFRHQSPSVIVGRIREANLWLLLAAIVVATLTFPIRAVRWQSLLRMNGATLPFPPLWHSTAIGFMANNLLPARAGEVARAVAVSQMTSVRFTAALASIGVERVMDGLAMVILMAVGIAAGGFAPDTDGAHLVRVAEIAGLAFVAALVTLVAIVHWPDAARAAVRRLANALLPKSWAAKVLDVFEGLIAGLDVLRSPARLAVASFWSFAVWTTYATSFWLCFRAFSLPVPWGGALLLQALIGFGVAIPAAPGFWGVWEAVTLITLNLYGIPDDGAASFAVAYHVGTFIPITVLGLWSLSRAHLHLGDLKGGGANAERPSGPGSRMTAARPKLEVTPPDRVRVAAHAKVNLFLRVLAREQSGYHSIETLFALLELADDLVAERQPAGVTLSVSGADTGPDADNLASRAAHAVLDATGRRFGAKLTLTKRIPVQAGLGGGSADAAAALHAVNRLAGDAIPRHELLQMAAKLGSDVAFAASGMSLALGWGRGERLFQLPPPPSAPAIVAVPPFGVSTKVAYGLIDQGRLTDASRGAVALDADAFRTWGGIGRLGGNDFEVPVFAGEPGLRDLFERVAGTRPLLARMSGSGSAVVGIYKNETERDNAAATLGEGKQRLVRTRTRALPAPGPEAAG